MSASNIPAGDAETLRVWFDIAPDAMIAVDGAGIIVLANQQAEHMFGHGHGALRGLALESLLPEARRDAHRLLRSAYMGRARVRPMGIGQELAGVTRDGREFPVEIGLSPIATDAGTLVIASIRDISDTRRVRQALERARRDGFLVQIGRLALESPDYEPAIQRIPELVAAALELPAVAIISTTPRRKVLRVRAATGLDDRAADALASIFHDGDFVHRAFGAGNRDAITADMLREGPLAAIYTSLAQAGFHNAAMVPLFGRYEPLGVLAALATTPIGFDRDKTDFLAAVANLLAAAVQRRRSEEQLSHAQRLDALGQLTGGIAHDFNNLLTVISGNLQLLEAELADRPATRETIDGALRAVDRGSELTRRLLAFARRQPLQPRAVVPKPLLDELGHMLRRTLGESVAVDVECSIEVPDVHADANELDTALVNLALNARDAMPRGGRLTIAAREAVVESPDNEWKVTPGRYVAFAVSDTGTGMPPDVQARALEPFFTTKPAGKGSGLGLSMVYGFATQSGGGISIESRLGYGTHVEFVLPVATTPAPAHAPGHTARSASAQGGESVLVVEDEADVRTIAARFLRAIGYAVVTAGSAREALDLLASHAGIDLLLSDVVLGGDMDGVKLAREVRRLHPGIAILLTSGHERFALASQDQAAIEFDLLRKPWRREQLADAVRDALDRAR